MFWAMAAAALFTVSCLATLTWVAVSRMSIRDKLLLGGFCVAILIAAYYLSGVSGISPFSIKTAVGLGPGQVQYGPLIGILGAILGVLGSIFFNKNITTTRLVRFFLSMT
jgi:hypothetical protein